MLADIAAIHDLGSAQARHAADVDAIGGRLAQVAVLLTSDGLGPVGARFLAAMCDAVHRDVRVARTLGETVTAHATTARHTALAYVDTEVAAKRHVSMAAP